MKNYKITTFSFILLTIPWAQNAASRTIGSRNYRSSAESQVLTALEQAINNNNVQELQRILTANPQTILLY